MFDYAAWEKAEYEVTSAIIALDEILKFGGTDEEEKAARRRVRLAIEERDSIR